MNKSITILFALAFAIAIVSAADFTPTGDINLRGIYSIKNGTNATFNGNIQAGSFSGNGHNLTDLNVNTFNSSTATQDMLNSNVTALQLFINSVVTGNYTSSINYINLVVNGNLTAAQLYANTILQGNLTAERTVTNNNINGNFTALQLYSNTVVSGNKTEIFNTANSNYSNINSAITENSSNNQAYTNTNILNNKTDLYNNLTTGFVINGNSSIWWANFSDIVGPWIIRTNTFIDFNGTKLQNEYLKIVNMFTQAEIVNMISQNETKAEQNANTAMNGNITALNTSLLSYTNTNINGNLTTAFNAINANSTADRTWVQSNFINGSNATINGLINNGSYLDTHNDSYIKLDNTTINGLIGQNTSLWNAANNKFNSTYASFNFTNGTGILLSGANQFNISKGYTDTLYIALGNVTINGLINNGSYLDTHNDSYIKLDNATINAGIGFWYNYTTIDTANDTITYVPYVGASKNLNLLNVNLTNVSFVSIGNIVPVYNFELNVSSTNYLMRLIGNINNYVEFNIFNKNNGSSSSTDIVATNNYGDDTNYYINMGINGFNFSNANWTINGANDGYLFVQNGSLAIGTSSTGKNISFFTGGVLAANEEMRINSNGFVGIGITNPSRTLDVRGLGNFSGTVYINNATDLATAFISGTNTTINGLVNNASYLNIFNGSYIDLTNATASFIPYLGASKNFNLGLWNFTMSAVTNLSNMFYANATHVAIGQTLNGQKSPLTVTGNVNISSSLILNYANTNITSNSSGYTIIYGATSSLELG